MTAKTTIINEIASKVGANYSAWQIGITEDAAKRKGEWGQTKNVSSWTHWKADSSTDAKDIEAHFLRKGLKGGTGGDIGRNTVFVYIF